MGKRELLLVFVFVIIGTVLYQVTAPPAPEGSSGFSLRDLFRTARSQMGDHDASRTVSKTTQLPVPEGAEVVVLDGFRGRLEVTGTDGPAIEGAMDVILRGIDEADLDQQEGELTLAMASDGARVMVTTAHRDMGPSPDGTLRLRMPRTLRLKVSGRGVAEITGVAGAEFDDYRGDLIVSEVTGPITGSHREGRAEFGAGSNVTLETRRGTLRLVRPASVTLDSEATDIEVSDATGPVSLEQERCTIELLGGSGPITVRGEGGTIKLRNVQSAVDIEAERLTVSMIMSSPAAVRIAVESDAVEVTLPDGGVEVAASMTHGELRAPAALSMTTDGDERRATGSLNGGGPRLDLQVVRGSLTIREP